MPIGLLLSTLAVRVVSGATGPTEFESWGWRIPFLISIVLVGIGFYVRLAVLETRSSRCCARSRPSSSGR